MRRGGNWALPERWSNRCLLPHYITITDLEQDQTLDAKAMLTVLGGGARDQIGSWASIGQNQRLLRRKKHSRRRFSTHTDNDGGGPAYMPGTTFNKTRSNKANVQ